MATQLLGGLIGANTSSIDAAAAFKVGTVCPGINGSQWMYVLCSTSVPAYYAVGVDEDYNANSLSSTFAAAGLAVGWPQVATSAGEYCWVALQGRGNISIAVAASCAADAPLYTTTTAGILDDSATATQTLVTGVVIVTTALSTTALTGTEAIATYPRGTE